MTDQTLTWKRVRRGYYETTDGHLYISRTRDGWEYGVIDQDGLARVDEVTRPLARVKVLAERIDQDESAS